MKKEPTNAELNRKLFWRLYAGKLVRNGEPFPLNILYKDGYPRHYARVLSGNGYVLDLEISVKKREFSVYIYIDNNIELYRKLLSYREEIEDELGFKLSFYDSNKNPENVKWIRASWLIYSDDSLDYPRVIDQTFDDVCNFINTFRKYL